MLVFLIDILLFTDKKKKRNRMTFDKEAFSTYRLKSYFICNFWSWSNVYSGDRDRALLDFLLK